MSLGGGCNLNRDIPALIGSAGFRIDEMEMMYLPTTPPLRGLQLLGYSAAPLKAGPQVCRS